jgi:hypothetical protein
MLSSGLWIQPALLLISGYSLYIRYFGILIVSVQDLKVGMAQAFNSGYQILYEKRRRRYKGAYTSIEQY